MKTQVEFVTPAMAREWLKRNTKNRPLRPSHVEALRLAFARGEYVVTHQGIAFDEDGELLDGQHRLQAIAQLEGGSFPLMVTRGLRRDVTFRNIDTGAAGRSISDVLGIDRKLSEVALFLARIHQARGGAVSPRYVEPFVEFVRPYHNDLMAFCGGATRTWSATPVRSAAVITMARGISADYVKMVYRSLVSADFAAMPPIAQGLYRAHSNGTVRAAASYDIFIRCMKAFDPKNASQSKTQIKDSSHEITRVREFLDACARAPATAVKRKAARGAAKGVSERDYRTPVTTPNEFLGEGAQAH